MERRNWATRPWADREATAPAGATGDGDLAMPYLWFLASSGDGDAFQSWATGPDTVFVPCFRSRDEAIDLARATGVEAAHVLGFPIIAIPDLMADLPHRVFVVTGISEQRRVAGHYLPLPPAAASHAA